MRHMNFEELVKKRETTYEFNGRNISSVNLNKILKAGILSPSFLNLQPWKFLVVRSKSVIGKLMETVSYGGFHNDPVVIIVPVLLGKFCNCKNSNASKKEEALIGGISSLGMASMSMILQGTDLGIQSAIISPKREVFRKVLKISPGDNAPLILAFGYIEKGAFRKHKERKKFKDVVRHEVLGKEDIL